MYDVCIYLYTYIYICVCTSFVFQYLEINGHSQSDWFESTLCKGTYILFSDFPKHETEIRVLE